MRKCLIYIDSDHLQNSFDLIEVAQQIYLEEKFITFGLVLNDAETIDKKMFDFLISINNKKIQNFQIKAITDIIEDIYQEYMFDSILIPGTFTGRMLAPRLAMRLHLGLTADVTEINHSPTGIEMVRPAYSGRLLAGVISKTDQTIMMSIRQNTFKPQTVPNKKMKIIDYPVEMKVKPGIEKIQSKEKKQKYDIRESNVLVSGGGGVIHDFKEIERLAKILKGNVSASRKMVDSGNAPRNIQVGQSGKTVSPKLYIALGIHGAIQHVEGLKNVEIIISVNTDIDAPIVSLSDIVIQGDAIEFIHKIIKRIELEEIK